MLPVLIAECIAMPNNRLQVLSTQLDVAHVEGITADVSAVELDTGARVYALSRHFFSAGDHQCACATGRFTDRDQATVFLYSRPDIA